MKRIFFPVLLILILWTAPADALTLTNLRVITGPLGSVRKTTKFLPGDVIYLTLDARDVQAEEKTGFIKYQTKMEIFDSLGKRKFVRPSPIKELPLLGGDRLPIDAFAILLPNQSAGNYQMKITVSDLIAKEDKTLTFDFEVLRKDFGIIQPIMPAVGFVGQDYKMGFAVVEMKRDKEELPNAKVTMNVENDIGRKVFKEDVELNIRELHNPVTLDIRKKNSGKRILAAVSQSTGQFHGRHSCRGYAGRSQDRTALTDSSA